MLFLIELWESVRDSSRPTSGAAERQITFTISMRAAIFNFIVSTPNYTLNCYETQNCGTTAIFQQVWQQPVYLTYINFFTIEWFQASILTK